MKILKKFLVSCLFSFLFVFSVNAEDINVVGSNYGPLDNIISQFPNWGNSKWVQEKAVEFYNNYLSSYDNVVITLRLYNSATDGNYSQFNIIPYGDYFNNIGFSYVAWNNNYPIYFLKSSSYVDFVDSIDSNSKWHKKNSDFVRGNYLYKDTSFTTMIEYGSSSYGSGFLTRAFYCQSLDNNNCLVDNSGFRGGSSFPIVYYNFKTQDKFILPANQSSNFNTTNNFILPNGTKIGNVNPIGFQDLMQDNYYNFGINNYKPQMYTIGDYDIGLNDLFFNINKNGFDSSLKGRIQFAMFEKYTEDFNLLSNFPLSSNTEGVDIIVDTKNSYCEENDGNTTLCTYDYKLSNLPSGSGYISIKMNNTNKLIRKKTLFLSSVQDTKISSFIQDTSYCTNYDNDYKRISTITNPKSVTFIREGNVRFPTDITNDSESLRGVFSFTWNEDFSYTESDFIVNFENNSKANLIGSYDFKCLGNSCFIDYHYASSSSKLEYANIKFIVTMPSEETKLIPKLNVNHCPNDSPVSITYDSNSTIDTIDSIIKKTFEDTGLDLSGLLNMPDLIDRGPIDSILTLPLNVLQTLTNTLSGSVCTPLTIKLPFVNKNMSIPCINTIYEEIKATTFFERVGSIASTIILINYFIFLYGWFEKVIRMEPMNIECWGFDNV